MHCNCVLEVYFNCDTYWKIRNIADDLQLKMAYAGPSELESGNQIFLPAPIYSGNRMKRNVQKYMSCNLVLRNRNGQVLSAQ